LVGAVATGFIGAITPLYGNCNTGCANTGCANTGFGNVPVICMLE